jgi:UDP-2,4-diacetamido-2,4,6-trideoxy-beta-L-altropyranose hydrolase
VTAPIFALRCDASLRMGSGHVMRCRILARALQARGAEIVLLCRRQPGDLIALLEQDFRVLVLPEYPPTCHEPDDDGHLRSGRALYAAWLGCDEQQDATDSLAALANAQLQPPAWLVVDHYGLGAPWQRWMQQGLRQADGSAPAVLVLDDLADRAHQANVLMDANRLDPVAPDPYRDQVPEACTRLLGPAYALLDPLYPRLQPLLPARSQLARVLVFFGGMDAVNHAAVALEALSHPWLLHLAVDVVVGAAAPHLADLESRVLHRPNTSLHVGLPTLAGLMARADLALGAAGTASWERACLGLPCLVVPVAENQVQGARALQSAGVARCLDLQTEVDPVAILQAALLELLDTPDALLAMSEACLQLGDGRGLGRVVAALLGPAPGLCLRSAQAADLWLYHWWASDPQVRRQSFNSDPIPLTQHRRWFAGRLNSPMALLRVLEDGDGLPLGQIRFERESETDARVVIGFSLDRLARGRGLAPLLLELGMAELARCWGNGCEAYGEVRADNPASCRAVLRAGFLECPPPRPGVRCFAKSTRSEP